MTRRRAPVPGTWYHLQRFALLPSRRPLSRTRRPGSVGRSRTLRTPDLQRSVGRSRTSRTSVTVGNVRNGHNGCFPGTPDPSSVLFDPPSTTGASESAKRRILTPFSIKIGPTFVCARPALWKRPTTDSGRPGRSVGRSRTSRTRGPKKSVGRWGLLRTVRTLGRRLSG